MHNERIGKPKVSEYLHSGFKVYSLLYEQTVGLMERCKNNNKQMKRCMVPLKV